jgi:hypothetical protein
MLIRSHRFDVHMAHLVPHREEVAGCSDNVGSVRVTCRIRYNPGIQTSALPSPVETARDRHQVARLATAGKRASVTLRRHGISLTGAHASARSCRRSVVTSPFFLMGSRRDARPSLDSRDAFRTLRRPHAGVLHDHGHEPGPVAREAIPQFAFESGFGCVVDEDVAPGSLGNGAPKISRY